jgi:hypothetical protein
MRRVTWVLILSLIVLHQDFWFWTDARLVFGFLPMGLFYHAVLSIAAAAVWWFVACRAWPDALDVTPPPGGPQA